jgi:hypothetical protein
MLELELPKEFAFLAKRKKQLKRELAKIEAMEANLLETRQLLDRAMNYIGSMTQQEFVNAPGGQYMRRFLDGKLEFTKEEIVKL